MPTTCDFDWKKALFALQGSMVITDENSPFEWVGSNGAAPCIIIIIHAIDRSGQKVAACGHLSAAESPYSIKKMIGLMNTTQILSAHLISADTSEEEGISQQLLNILKENGVEAIHLSLGKGISEAAIHVRTGEITHSVMFTPQNAGEKDLACLELYALQAKINILTNPGSQASRPTLTLAVDGRSAEHIERVQKLLETAQPPKRHDTIFDSFSFMQPDLIMPDIHDFLDQDELSKLNIYTSLMSLFGLDDSDLFNTTENYFNLLIIITNMTDVIWANSTKAIEAAPERKMITDFSHSDMEARKERLRNPRVSLRESRLWFISQSSIVMTNIKQNSITCELDESDDSGFRQKL